jgi:hypothetical protein
MEPAIFLLLIPLLLKDSGSPSSSSRFNLPYYKPGSREQVDLFLAASKIAGTPTSWVVDSQGNPNPYLVQLIRNESGGWVGRPNYEFGYIYKTTYRDHWPALWEHLRAGGAPPKGRGATGLGQLILTTADKHYPHGRQGIGDALNEAVGMLSYINGRWKSPERAIQCYKPNSCTCTVGSNGRCLDGGTGIKGYPPKTWGGY